MGSELFPVTRPVRELSGRESQHKGISLFLLEGGVSGLVCLLGSNVAAGVAGESVACTPASEPLWLRYYDDLSQQNKK